ncbi:hypothetical protein [Sinorhizobium sp. BG8]|uniref:hypothetical protein n=1 Tax=Sinorhizobium sp. BG8 TaxID=2613773 RepID=UPI00193E3178|nr:hypothetical protein [Sinorhizobium sp. BG8]QRM54669.1 hypothetical protein F3Y30_09010 [Sinorhizobium sp. BG8]
MGNRVSTVHCLLLLLAGLSGCAESAAGWQHRYGPDPLPPPNVVVASTENQLNIMASLRRVAMADGTATTADVHYLTTLAGFNFVDEQCDVYLKELFVLDQERTRLRRGIDSAGLLTNAVLATTTASKATMAITTQAFGLTSQYVDVLANGYLYGVNAATIFGIVSKLQAAYRDQTDKDKTKINSTPAAYARIRGYLQLCMPPSIESKINEALASATAVAGSKATGATTEGSGSATQTSLVPAQAH